MRFNAHLISLAVISFCAFTCCSGQVICDRSIYANTIGYASPHTSVTCNVTERCGRIEGTTTAGKTFFGTNCYAAIGCVGVNDAACQTIARTLLSAVIETNEVISTCSSGCCDTFLCNLNLLPYSHSTMVKPHLLSIALLLCSVFFFVFRWE